MCKVQFRGNVSILKRGSCALLHTGKVFKSSEWISSRLQDCTAITTSSGIKTFPLITLLWVLCSRRDLDYLGFNFSK